MEGAIPEEGEDPGTSFSLMSLDASTSAPGSYPSGTTVLLNLTDSAGSINLIDSTTTDDSADPDTEPANPDAYPEPGSGSSEIPPGSDLDRSNDTTGDDTPQDTTDDIPVQDDTSSGSADSISDSNSVEISIIWDISSLSFPITTGTYTIFASFSDRYVLEDGVDAPSLIMIVGDGTMPIAEDPSAEEGNTTDDGEGIFTITLGSPLLEDDEDGTNGTEGEGNKILSFPNATVTVTASDASQLIKSMNVTVDKGNIVQDNTDDDEGHVDDHYQEDDGETEHNAHQVKRYIWSNGKTADQVQTILRGIKFKYTDGMKVTVDVNGNAASGGSEGDSKIDNISEYENKDGKVHYYTFVTATKGWVDAYNYAKTLSYNGNKGYLAKIETTEELTWLQKYADSVSHDEQTENNSGGSVYWYVGGTMLEATGSNVNNNKINDADSLDDKTFSTPSSYLSDNDKKKYFYWACGPGSDEDRKIDTGLWANNEPNNSGPNAQVLTENVVTIMDRQGMNARGLNDSDWDNSHRFIVEFGGYPEPGSDSETGTGTESKGYVTGYDASLKGDENETYKEVTLTYDIGEGATGTPSNAPDNLLNTSVVTPSDAGNLKKGGYTFKGWSTTENATSSNAGTIYDQDNPYIMPTPKDGESGAFTLYAVWDPNKYNISFDMGGGSNSGSTGENTTDSSYTVSTGSQTITLPTPTKPGYKFTRWTVSWIEDSGNSGGGSSSEAASAAIDLTAPDNEDAGTGETTDETANPPSDHGDNLPTVDGNTLTIPADCYGYIKLTAQWEEITNTDNGGSGNHGGNTDGGNNNGGNGGSNENNGNTGGGDNNNGGNNGGDGSENKETEQGLDGSTERKDEDGNTIIEPKDDESGPGGQGSTDSDNNNNIDTDRDGMPDRHSGYATSEAITGGGSEEVHSAINPSIAQGIDTGHWFDEGGFRYYRYSRGELARGGFALIKGPEPNEANSYYWYHFDEAGRLSIGWIDVNGDRLQWSYSCEETGAHYGAIQTGWLYCEEDGRTYYLSTVDGLMLTGWVGFARAGSDSSIGTVNTDTSDAIDWYYFKRSEDVTRDNWFFNSGIVRWFYDQMGFRSYGALYVNEMTPDGYMTDFTGLSIGKAENQEGEGTG